MSVIRVGDVDVSQLVYSVKCSNPKHSLDSYYISYETEGRWPRVQFPWLRHPFDAMNDRFHRERVPRTCC